MTDTFNWKVHATSSGGGQLSVFEAKFGDGYMQEAPNGINPDLQRWNITVGGYTDEAQEIVDFIREHIGQSFYWTPPLSVQGYYRCRDYQPVPQGGGYYTVNATFYQVGVP